MTTTLLCVVGTRPEAIKMAPVILALRQKPWARVRVLATAQHREMLDEAMAPFGISADLDLNIMQPGQPLPELTARLLTALDHAIDSERPEAILAQGDTTTVLAAALAAFYQHVPFCHVEAGLRTGNPENPFPEEMNRTLVGRLARLHFAPTEQAKRNLLQEGISADRVFVTGNTVIDALYLVAEKEVPFEIKLPAGKRLILLTAHRRENFGAPLQAILQAVRALAQKHRDLHFVYPVHLNPNVAGPVRETLGNLPGVTLCPPLGYGQIVALMKGAWLVLTDSGGLQEEAPALRKPVLVLRDETERPEAVQAGVAKLVGPHYDAIVAAVESLMTNQLAYQEMSRGASPYGDGLAAQRIVMYLENFLCPEKSGKESKAGDVASGG